MEAEVKKVDISLELRSANEILLSRRNALLSQLDMWYRRKGEFWKQFARDKFMKEVDRNSKYFHTVATVKKRKKQLLELQITGRSFKESRRIK